MATDRLCSWIIKISSEMAQQPYTSTHLLTSSTICSSQIHLKLGCSSIGIDLQKTNFLFKMEKFHILWMSKICWMKKVVFQMDPLQKKKELRSVLRASLKCFRAQSIRIVMVFLANIFLLSKLDSNQPRIWRTSLSWKSCVWIWKIKQGLVIKSIMM